MSKKKLEQIEHQLSKLDAEAMSFDHTDAEQCKLALGRIVETAVKLCTAIKADPSRENQKPKLQWDHNRMMQQATLTMPRKPVILGPPTSVTKVGGGKIVVKK